MHSLDRFIDNYHRLMAHLHSKEKPMVNRTTLNSATTIADSQEPAKVVPFDTVKFLKGIYDGRTAEAQKLDRELSQLAEEIAFLERHPGYQELLIRIAERLRAR